MRLRAVFTALVVVGATAPVGVAQAAPPPTTAGASIDACALLDRATIGDALGGDAGRAEHPGGDTCRWFVEGAVPDQSERTVVFLTVDRYRGIAKRSLLENADESSAVALDDLTEANIAFYDLEVQPPAVTVVKGRRIIIVQVGHLANDRLTVDALTALAETAFERL